MDLLLQTCLPRNNDVMLRISHRLLLVYITSTTLETQTQNECPPTHTDDSRLITSVASRRNVAMGGLIMTPQLLVYTRPLTQQHRED